MVKIETYKPFNPKIYAYTTLNISTNEGWIKIGYTTQNDVMRRIYQQTHTVGAQPHHEWDLPARFEDTGETFKDFQFHRYLTRICHVKRRKGTEWFQTDGVTSLKYFEQFCRRQFKTQEEFYELRAEQIDAVERTLKYFQSGDTPREFLWNAKPRFGKTLSTYDFICRLNLQRVLIVTNRPSIANSWLDDFNKFIAHKTSYKFVCNGGSFTGASVVTYDDEYRIPRGQQIIAFLSLQDLKGAKIFGGDFDKLNWISKTPWDLLIVDEAHEGVDTDKTHAAFKKIKRAFTLYLSGTPFKALANDKFREDQIFNWSYEEEQQAKADWHEESANPYEDLPQMHMFSYKIPQATIDKINRGVELEDGEHVDSAFDLNEFFRTNESGKFVYEADVLAFLDDLSTKKDFPFSPAFRDELHHTFWLLQRVDSAHALAELLRRHKVFRQYKIIVAAGKNSTDDTGLRDSYDKVQHAIHHNAKTITLSVGQLTTGVTVPGWTGVLMLSNLKSAAAYMQAAFRAQNPHVGKDLRKENCYVFDFAPERALTVYDEFANNLKTNNSNRTKNIGALLNFFPIISQDDAGSMTKLSTESFTSILNKIKIRHVVDNKFIDNNLFANVSHVFGAAYQQEVTNILDKLAPDASDSEKIPPDIEFIENPGVKLGPKVAPPVIKTQPRDKSEREKFIDLLVKEISKLFEKDIAAAKFSKQQTAKLRADSNHRVRKNLNALDAFTYPEIQQIVDAEKIALEIAINELKIANDRKNFDDQIRAHLRGFARTIPSFIMAYCAESAAKNIPITLKNLETFPDDKTFLAVTSITKDEFRRLRELKFFNESIFNGAIVEFLRRKAELADYFTGAHDKDIFDFIPPQRTSQIFTPRRVVVEMIDALERENPSIFDDPTQKFLDPYMKSGMFIAEIVKRLYEHFIRRARQKNKHLSAKAKRRQLKHILTRQVYGFAPTEIIFRIATEYIFGADAARNISRRNFYCSQRMEVTILNKFGEVFTPPEIVKEMLAKDEIQAEIHTLHSKFFEPATGEAAFLTEILRQKLTCHVPDTRADNWIYKMLWCAAGLYGIEIQPKNVSAARANLKAVFAQHFQNITGKPLDANSSLAQSMNALFDYNILPGDATKTQSAAPAFCLWLHDDFDIHLARRKAFPYHAFFADKNQPSIFDLFDVSETFDLINLHRQSFAHADSEDISDELRKILVVCNPPYQGDTKGDNKTFAASVYDKFLACFHAAFDRVLMIHPARFLFQAGATPKKFIDDTLADEHFKVVRYFPNASDVFSGVDIKGGVAITWRDAKISFGAIKVFIPFPQLKSIFDKVTQREDFKPLTEIMRGTCIFHFTEQLHVENPTAIKKMSKGHDLDITTDAFDNFPDIFLDDKPNDGREYIQMYGLTKRQRAFKWIRRDYVREIPELLKYKVMIPAAYGGAGALREKAATMLVGLPLVGLPLVGYTDSFIGVYRLNNGAEAANCLKYVKTKFARAMLGVLKVTQHATPDKWRYVPQQDFSAGSDVPWELSVAQIDEFLYAKYKLTAEETGFIEANVKAMD